MKRTYLLAAILLVLTTALAGCPNRTTFSPEAQHLAARETFDTTVKGLTAAIDAGQFSDEQALTILELARAGREALNAWEHALTSHTATEDLIADYHTILTRLSVFRRKEQSDGR